MTRGIRFEPRLGTWLGSPIEFASVLRSPATASDLEVACNDLVEAAWSAGAWAEHDGLNVMLLPALANFGDLDERARQLPRLLDAIDQSGQKVRDLTLVDWAIRPFLLANPLNDAAYHPLSRSAWLARHTALRACRLPLLDDWLRGRRELSARDEFATFHCELDPDQAEVLRRARHSWGKRDIWSGLLVGDPLGRTEVDQAVDSLTRRGWISVEGYDPTMGQLLRQTTVGQRLPEIDMLAA